MLLYVISISVYFGHLCVYVCMCGTDVFSFFFNHFVRFSPSLAWFFSFFTHNKCVHWRFQYDKYWILNIGFWYFWGRRRVNTILTLITLDYRQTINITAALLHYQRKQKATAYTFAKSAHVLAHKKTAVAKNTNQLRCI